MPESKCNECGHYPSELDAPSIARAQAGEPFWCACESEDCPCAGLRAEYTTHMVPFLVSKMPRREMQLRLTELALKYLDAFDEQSGKHRNAEWLDLTTDFLSTTDSRLRDRLTFELAAFLESASDLIPLEELEEDHACWAGRDSCNTAEEALLLPRAVELTPDQISAVLVALDAYRPHYKSNQPMFEATIKAFLKT
jgi:hypothetical protein